MKEHEDALSQLYFEELRGAIGKIERSSQTYEHWEASIEEMRKRFGFLLHYTDTCAEENTMINLITEFDRLQP